MGAANPHAGSSAVMPAYVALAVALLGCSSDATSVVGASGMPGSGGATGMPGSGGASAPANSGGATASGGSVSGGTTSSGGATASGGGDAAGGTAGSGGESGGAGGTSGTGGGSETGGSASSGGTSGSGGAVTLPFSYFIGADITWVQADEARGATFVDGDGDPQDVLQILKSHGFNSVRLRTFVDPRAADGYDRQNGNADLAHTVSFGKRIKAAGMGLLVDFHYSDNWADPGKQCVPIAWQHLTTIQELAQAVHDYTKNAVSELVAAGARPDMVQIGNEITPGMLLHVCDSGGQPTGSNRVTGSSDNFANLGVLLEAGLRAVKEVDTSILTMLHIDRCNDFGTSRWFIDGVLAEHVEFEVFGESCYQASQGTPGNAQATKSAWSSTLSQLTARYPNLKFVAAEYGPMQREINDVVFGLPNQKGAGTFNWEPTHPGDWNTGHALFAPAGNRYTATADLMFYDAMQAAYASRL